MGKRHRRMVFRSHLKAKQLVGRAAKEAAHFQLFCSGRGVAQLTILIFRVSVSDFRRRQSGRVAVFPLRAVIVLKRWLAYRF